MRRSPLGASSSCRVQGVLRADSLYAVLCSLASILSKRTLAPGKLDEIKIKANILGAFRPVVEKAEEAQAEAETRDEL